jgi:hypothetical protein
MKSTTEKIKSSSSSSVKSVLTSVMTDVGGIVNTRTVGSLPRNYEQVSYYRKKDNSQKACDVLYNVMLQCKSCDKFVRSVVAAPEPMAVICTDQQLDNMVRIRAS